MSDKHYPPAPIQGQLDEPWVALADSNALKAWGRDQEIAYNQTNRQTEKARAKKYFDLMPDGVFSIGRAGSYLYNVDIDDTIDHAMKVAQALKA